MTLLIACLGLSLDSLLVSFAVGPLIPTRKTKLWLAFLFGVCDGVAALLGSYLPRGWGMGGLADLAGPFALITFGAYFIVGANWSRVRVSPLMVSVLPIVLSLDNLAFGARADGMALTGIMQPTLLGLASFALSLGGFACSRPLRLRPKRRLLWFAGLSFVTYSLVLIAF